MIKKRSQAFTRLIDYINTKSNDWTLKVLNERFEYHGAQEYRSIRYEIRNCLVFGFDQAAISLTNLYPEKFLKVSLMDQERTTKMDDLDKHNAEIERLVEKYGGRDLGLNIDSAKKLGIITKEESLQLIAFKDKFRNPFSHYDIKRIYGENQMNLQSFSLDPTISVQDSIAKSLDDTSTERKSMKVANLIPMQDMWLENFAKSTSLAYFVWIDNLVCRRELKNYPELKGFQLNKEIDFDSIFSLD